MKLTVLFMAWIKLRKHKKIQYVLQSMILQCLYNKKNRYSFFSLIQKKKKRKKRKKSKLSLLTVQTLFFYRYQYSYKHRSYWVLRHDLSTKLPSFFVSFGLTHKTSKVMKSVSFRLKLVWPSRILKKPFTLK